MKRVAVLGGGPAGAFAAERLSRAGLSTVVLDEKLAWEKPCGGGLTYKAYHQYPFLIENESPKKIVSRTCLSSATGETACLELTKPLVIYSRLELNSLLLRRAGQAGAALEKSRVLGLERRGRGWRVRTKSGDIDADFCIVATGARNPIRQVGTEWAAGDTMSALGYFIPATQEHVDLRFFPDFEGYIWVFPRDGHLSAGIAGKGKPAQELRSMLERYLRERGIPLEGATFYGHVIPSLGKSRWESNRVAGDGWLAVGDAAGLVDPVTGEGLYYAIRSADIAAEALLHGECIAERHRSVLWKEFGADLEVGARLAKRLFRGRFLGGDVTSRMIQFIRRSPTLCHIVQDLFAGTQSYLDLKPRLKANMNGTMRDVLISFASGCLGARQCPGRIGT
jgi:geranylgeranyl reductase family protein